MVPRRIERKLIERTQRVKEAIALKEPDRVPITPFADMFFAGNQAGLTHKEVVYNNFKASRAALKVYSRYDWDLYPPFFITVIGKENDTLDNKLQKWPGAAHPDSRLDDDAPFQYVEKAWMTADEYKEMNTDVTGFLLRKVLPRQNHALEGFASLPYASLLSYFGNLVIPGYFMQKDIQTTLRKLRPLRTMKNMMGFMLGQMRYNKKMFARGNPVVFMNGIGLAPFDIIGDTIRGMKGTMLDMRRNPEDLKNAINIMADQAIRGMGALDPMLGEKHKYSVQMSFIPLHRGADGFMSNAQFEEFYWPSLTRVMEEMIEKGYTPMPFFEGCYNDRLPYLADFAKKHPGKLIYWFQTIDMKKVKDMMGDYVTLRGNVPASLLVGGTPQQVEDYVKQTIEDCAEGGGLLIDGGVSGIVNEARHENVKAMTDAVHKYGVYRK